MSIRDTMAKMKLAPAEKESGAKVKSIVIPEAL